jgi:steroid 5-alpha reductase family enzyme
LITRTNREAKVLRLRIIDMVALVALIALVLSHCHIDSLRTVTDFEIIVFFFLGLPIVVARIIRGATLEARLTTDRLFIFILVTILSVVIFKNKFANEAHDTLYVISNNRIVRIENRSGNLMAVYTLQALLFDFIAFDTWKNGAGSFARRK